MKSLYEALSKSMIKKIKTGNSYYLIIPYEDTYSEFAKLYRKHYVRVAKDMNFPNLGAYILDEKQIEQYFNHPTVSIYEIKQGFNSLNDVVDSFSNKLKYINVKNKELFRKIKEYKE